MRACLFQCFICRPCVCLCVRKRKREIQLLCVSCVVNTNKGFSKPLQTEMKVLSSFSLLILCQFASLQSTCTGQKSWSWPNRMRLPELLRCTCSSHCLPLRLGFFFSQVGVASEKRRGDVNNRWRWKARDRPISYIYRYCIFRWGTAAVHCPFRRFFLPSFLFYSIAELVNGQNCLFLTCRNRLLGPHPFGLVQQRLSNTNTLFCL